MKCSKAFEGFQFVYVNGSYLEAEGDYAGGCPYGDPHCEDVVKFEFPVFNLLFLGKFLTKICPLVVFVELAHLCFS